MSRLSRRMLILVSALTLAMTLPVSVSASHSWGGYHWARTANPFTLKLGDNVTSAWDTYLATTSSDWSASDVLDTTIVAGGSRSAKLCNATTGQVQVCNAKYGNNGWLGVASIWASGGHITKATVKLNDTYFNTADYNKPAWRNLVSCQEVGHTFGLGHQDETFNNPNLGSCMDYTNDPGTNQHPNRHDYDELGIIYGHLDLTTTVASSPAIAPAARAPAADAAWGRLMQVTNHGHGAWYLRDLGAGNVILTHVFWAD
ncbi:MAG: hypothetical protein A2Z32_11490 [Chloroflexi bacterium RBG_16_69_14]|nr:MAG: hypothetical protein A2Z32_11490 [Chloroflexi bacterium RBG_16_69_14]